MQYHGPTFDHDKFPEITGKAMLVIGTASNESYWEEEMTANIVSGMDLDKLEEFRSALKENPVILGLEARGVWEGHSGRSTIHIGPYELGALAWHSVQSIPSSQWSL